MSMSKRTLLKCRRLTKVFPKVHLLYSTIYSAELAVGKIYPSSFVNRFS